MSVLGKIILSREISFNVNGSIILVVWGMIDG